MRSSLLVVCLLITACSSAADFDFYGRSGDAIALDFGSLPGVPPGATFSGLSLSGFFGHPVRTSSQLDQGDFAADGRLWVFPNASLNTSGQGDARPEVRGFQGVLDGTLMIDGQPKSFAVTVQPGYTGAGLGAVQQSLERLNRAANNPLYVAQQQQRLKYFGYVRQGGAPISVDGDFGPNTDSALRTFQAAIVGGVNTTQTNVDGIIGPNTAGWLNAANAPTWEELTDPDPQPYPPNFSVSRMFGDFDILPSFDPDGSGRTGRTPQIERFGTSWSLELFVNGSAAANEATGITQLMNGMSTVDGYGSAAFHNTHRAGMDIDLHVADSTHNFGNGSVSADEQGVIDTAVAMIDTGLAGESTQGSVLRYITSNRDILDGIQSARPGVAAFYDSSGGHRNHLHLDVGAPSRVAGMPNLLGDFNRDDSIDAADYTVWRDGLGRTRRAEDYSVWAAGYADTAGALAAVPEPTGLVAAAIVLIGGLIYRKRSDRTKVARPSASEIMCPIGFVPCDVSHP